MAPLSTVSILSLCLLLPATLALPYYRPYSQSDDCTDTPYPTLTPTSSEGVYPSGFPTGAGTGTVTLTGTGTAYYPTASVTYYIGKREPEYPYGYPPPHDTTCTSDALPTSTSTEDPAPTSTSTYYPTGTAAPISSTYYPTGTAPQPTPPLYPTGAAPGPSPSLLPTGTIIGTGTGAGTSSPYPTYYPNKRDLAEEAHHHYFEGPRRRDVQPYYPYIPAPSQTCEDPEASGTITATAGPTGPTGTSVAPTPGPTGTSVASLSARPPVTYTSSSVVVVPTYTSSSVIVAPSASGKGGYGYGYLTGGL